MKRSTLHKATALLALFSPACCCFGQSTTSNNPTALLETFRRLGDSVGFEETTACGAADALARLSERSIQSASTTGEVIKLLADSGIKSDLLAADSILIFIGDRPKLPATKLDHFQIDYGMELRKQLGGLWSMPDILKQASALKIRLGPFHSLGFSSLTPDQKQPKRDLVNYADTSLLQILSDSLLHRRGLIWIYNEVECHGNLSMQFTVVSEGQPR
jgi:hypothetical protein